MFDKVARGQCLQLDCRGSVAGVVWEQLSHFLQNLDESVAELAMVLPLGGSGGSCGVSWRSSALDTIKPSLPHLVEDLESKLAHLAIGINLVGTLDLWATSVLAFCTIRNRLDH